MMQINFHNPVTSNSWIAKGDGYGAVEVSDAHKNRVSIFIDSKDTDFLRALIADAAKMLAVLEQNQ